MRVQLFKVQGQPLLSLEFEFATARWQGSPALGFGLSLWASGSGF